jgi:hypothetical protein
VQVFSIFIEKSLALLEDIEQKKKKKQRKPVTYIVKPGSGSQGNGISLTQNLTTAIHLARREDESIIQRYVSKVCTSMSQSICNNIQYKPLLIDGYKFDLRIYVLIVSLDPLRLYIYEDGLVRLCTEQYTEPKEDNLVM